MFAHCAPVDLMLCLSSQEAWHRALATGLMVRRAVARGEKASYGNQRLWGAVGWGYIFAPGMGAVLTYAPPVRPGIYCSPRHPTHFEPSSLNFMVTL